MILVCEYEFDLKFLPFFTVPYQQLDPAAYLVSAGPKLTANLAGQRQWVGTLVVRDRRVPGAPPGIGVAYVVHRTGQEAEVPEGAGTLVGSFSTHQGEHHWHVFAPKPKPAQPRPTEAGAASPSRTASAREILPVSSSKETAGPLPRPSAPPTGRAASGSSGAKPASIPSPERKA